MLGLHTLNSCSVLVAGVGAIGRQIALSLATMGTCKSVTIVDPDVVADPNMGTQGYLNDQRGVSKVEATKADMLARNPKLQVRAFEGMLGYATRVGTKNHWKPETRHDVLFLCVDDMITRNEVAKSTKYKYLPTKFLIDTRMGAWAARVIADVPPFDRWRGTLFSDSAAFSGACTLQSTFFAANVAAGHGIAALCTLVGAVTPDPMDAIFNLLDCDVTHQSPEPPANPIEHGTIHKSAVNKLTSAAFRSVPGRYPYA
jgi:hypothetical protein